MSFCRSTLLSCLLVLGFGLPTASTVLADDAETTQDPDEDLSEIDTRPTIAPDIRDDDTKLKIQKGDFVIVPIPISNPTLGTGLIVGAAYFYAQTAEQAKVQPASMTGAGAMYTTNDSRAFLIGQQNYWKKDRWRFTGAVGAADLRLSLLTADESSDGTRVDYRVSGPLLFAQLARRISGDWYGGLRFQAIAARQSIEANSEGQSDDLDISDVNVGGIGPTFEFDSRDLPLNSYSGQHFRFTALLNRQSLDADSSYQTYSAFYRYYHSLKNNVVLGLDVRGCARAGTVPLFNACTVGLRGFAVTDYLGMSSASAQVEARWKFSKHWGLVAFGGVGTIGESFSGLRDDQSIPSYGAGIRFMVLQSKRINMRVDYARSRDSDAWYLSVGEAF